MIYDEGAERFAAHYPAPRETLAKLQLFRGMVVDENSVQNLVSASTISAFWDRHILDSAQIVTLAPHGTATWLDVGSGAGLPGIVTALLTDAEHLLIEPRRRRANFLSKAIAALGLAARVKVLQAAVEKVVFKGPAVVTARAFAPLTRTLQSTSHLGDAGTLRLLHKGRTALTEVAEAETLWEGRFELIPSITDPDAALVRISGLAWRGSA